jgi:hypothetical protein
MIHQTATAAVMAVIEKVATPERPLERPEAA